ncbi:MAG: hypothetical protein AB1486_08970 [Planctomycetota bacterium]
MGQSPSARVAGDAGGAAPDLWLLVLAKVGILRFLESRQRREIQAQLRAPCGDSIPEGMIQELIERFVDTVRALHEDRIPRLRQLFEASGGYVLHVDGTCDEWSQVHLACLAALTGPEPIMLWSEKIESENAVDVRAVLHEVTTRFGRPAAAVQDLSAPIRNALLEEWPGLPIFYCHWHFLADVGKDLLGEHYQRLRTRLRETQARPKLRQSLKRIDKELGGQRAAARSICERLEDPDLLKHNARSLKAAAIAGGMTEWILAAPAAATGQGFPFDLPHLTFYGRARQAAQILDRDILPKLTGHTPRGERLLYRLRGVLANLLRPASLQRTARRLEDANQLFTRLRDALRLATAGPTRRLNEDSSSAGAAEAREAEQAVTHLREQLRVERKSAPSPDARKGIDIIITHLEKYWNGLFGHCLELPDSDHRPFMVQRTNNISERFFRANKRFERRITGKTKLNRQVDALPGHALLVFNLNNPDYVSQVCGSLEQLPKAFTELAQESRLDRGAKKTGPALLNRESRRRPGSLTAVAAAFAGS